MTAEGDRLLQLGQCSEARGCWHDDTLRGVCCHCGVTVGDTPEREQALIVTELVAS